MDKEERLTSVFNSEAPGEFGMRTEALYFEICKSFEMI
jgi:hypothetical protein